MVISGRSASAGRDNLRAQVLRKVEFIPDGKRRCIEPAMLIEAWRAVTFSIPAQYVLGTAEHESDLTLNEIDTEESGFVSRGIFQVSDEECYEVGAGCEVDPLDLSNSCYILVALCERRLDKLIAEASLRPTGPWPPDIWAYLAIAHNQGLSAACKSIRRFGLNWSRYKQRNSPQGAYFARMAAYGDDVISGGLHWRPEFEIL